MGDDYSADVVKEANGYEAPSESDIEDAIRACMSAAAGAYNRNVRDMANISQTTPTDNDYLDSNDFEWMLDYFKKLYERDPADAAALRAPLPGAKTAISSAHVAQVGGQHSLFDHWEGDTARHFKTYFLIPFPNAVNCQKGVVDELIAAIACYEAVLKRAREDAKRIADEAKQVFENLYDNDLSWDVVLKLVGVAVSIASAIPSAGTSLTLAGTLGLIGTGVSLVEYAGSLGSIEGGSVSEVEQTLKDTIDKAVEAMQFEEEEIARAVTMSVATVRDTLNGRKKPDQYGPYLPDPLTTATLLPHEPRGDGVPDLTRGKTPTKEDMYPIT